MEYSLLIMVRHQKSDSSIIYFPYQVKVIVSICSNTFTIVRITADNLIIQV